MRGESFTAASWECGLHLINGHHSVISNCHIMGHTGGFYTLISTLISTRLYWYQLLGLRSRPCTLGMSIHWFGIQ